MFSIGEFSRISGLSIKALRLYHEREILIPSNVDDKTGYRYYDKKNLERARIINHLRKFEFSLDDIAEILENVKDEADVVDFFLKQKESIASKIRQQKNIINDLGLIIDKEKEAIMTLENHGFDIEEKELDTILIAGIRYKGRYDDCGDKFGEISKKVGRFISGKPFNLYYDSEFKEDGADIETCMPVRKGKDVNGINIRELPGGHCVSLIHKGPYENLNRSYEKIINYIKEKGYKDVLPIREVYVKGPGMIFKGNPKNYLTEIQIMVEK